MKTVLKSSIVTLFLIALSITVVAQQRSDRTDRPRGKQHEQMHKADRGNQHQAMMKRLDLSDGQKTEMKEIHLAGQKAMLPLKNELREEYAHLRTLTSSENFDEAAVKNTINSIAEIRAELMLEQVTHHQEVRSLLTEEQRIKFDSFNHKKHNAQLGQPFGDR